MPVEKKHHTNFSLCTLLATFPIFSLSQLKHIINMTVVTSSFNSEGTDVSKIPLLTLLSQLMSVQRTGSALQLKRNRSGGFPHYLTGPVSLKHTELDVTP